MHLGVNVGSVTFSRNAAGIWPSSWVLRVLAGLVVPFTVWLMVKADGSAPHQEAVLKSLLHKTHQKPLLRTLRRGDYVFRAAVLKHIRSWSHLRVDTLPQYHAVLC